MRPRSAGTFLISRSETSAKRCACSTMRSMRRAVEILDRQQVLHAHATSSAAEAIATSSRPSSSRTRTCTCSAREVGRFLPT